MNLISYVVQATSRAERKLHADISHYTCVKLRLINLKPKLFTAYYYNCNRKLRSCPPLWLKIKSNKNSNNPKVFTYWVSGTSFLSVTSHQLVNGLKYNFNNISPPKSKKNSHFTLGNKSSMHLIRKILLKFIFREKKSSVALSNDSSWEVKGFSAVSRQLWDVSVQPSCPPPLFQLSAQHFSFLAQSQKIWPRCTSQRVVLSGWGQDAVTRKRHSKMQECPQGLFIKLMSQPVPLVLFNVRTRSSNPASTCHYLNRTNVVFEVGAVMEILLLPQSLISINGTASPGSPEGSR